MLKEKSSAKIIPLSRIHLPIGETDKAIVELLVELCNKSERGELIGLCCAWVEGNNEVTFQIKQGSAPAAPLIAGVTGLFYEINRRWAQK